MAFQKVARLDDVEVGSACKVEIGGTPIALVRSTNDTVKAVHNLCSHQRYELAPDGSVEGNTIECPQHGSIFDLDTGEPDSLPAVAPIPVYACKVERGAVFVDPDRRLNDAPLPRY